MAKHYTEIPVDKWNVGHFHAYLADEHQRRYNVSYAPFRGWTAEKGMIARYIGTAKKRGLYSKEIVKDFIDRCYDDWRPNAQYSGVSFGFMSTYMTRHLQDAEKAAQVKRAEAEASEEMEGLAEWL